MAFTIEKLVPLGGNAKRNKQPMSYSFWNEDTDTVTGAGYFEKNDLVVGDQIVVISADYTTRVDYYVSAVASGAATVVASS